MNLDTFVETAAPNGLSERLDVLEHAFPGALRSIRTESRLDETVWTVVVEAICTTPPDASPLATSIGRVTISYPYVGGRAAVDSEERLGRLVEFDRVSADLIRARNGAAAEADPSILRNQVTAALDARDLTAFHLATADEPLSRYPMWATFVPTGSYPPCGEPSKCRDDWIRLGLSPEVPRYAVLLWYVLPEEHSAYIPTVCNAFAGNVASLNECFQPSEATMSYGQTVACEDHERRDGMPEVIHEPIPGRFVVALEKLTIT